MHINILKRAHNKNMYERDIDTIKWRHYVNDIWYSRLPFSICWALSISISFFMLHLKNVMGTNFIWSGGLVLFMFIICCWWIWCWFQDVLSESVIDSRYNKKLRAALVCGFLLFLVSEIMLFGGFFWAFFDRVYNPGYATSICLPSDMENIDYMRWPLLGTIVLITSGYTANQAYYFVRAGVFNYFFLCAWVTLLLAVSFLCIQLMEYNGLSFTISDNVYGSFFYLLTGFHGFHVTIGFLFLCEQYGRISAPLFRFGRLVSLAQLHFNRDRHLGLAFSLIYWHFVDIIWIFLFISVYVFK